MNKAEHGEFFRVICHFLFTPRFSLFIEVNQLL